MLTDFHGRANQSFALWEQRISSKAWALSVVPHFSLSPPRGVVAWGDFYERARFARCTIPEEKWGTTRSLGLLAKPLKKFPKSPIRLALTLDKRQSRLFKLRLIGLYASTYWRIYYDYFLFNGFIRMRNLHKRLIRAAFWLLLQAMFASDWKQTAQRLKLHKRLLTINKRKIIYRDNNFHSRRQVLKCLWKSLFMF